MGIYFCVGFFLKQEVVNPLLQFYTSTLVSLGPADMCTIEYDEYGNRSSVPVGVLLPLQAF